MLVLCSMDTPCYPFPLLIVCSFLSCWTSFLFVCLFACMLLLCSLHPILFIVCSFLNCLWFPELSDKLFVPRLRIACISQLSDFTQHLFLGFLQNPASNQSGFKAKPNSIINCLIKICAQAVNFKILEFKWLKRYFG